MPHWTKLILDPAHFAVLKSLDKPNTKKNLAEETGLQVERCQRIIQNLMEEEMIGNSVENGVRKVQRKDSGEKLDDIKQNLISELVGSNRNAVEQENYEEARKNLTQDLPVEGDTRKTVAQLEAAEKLDSLL